MDPVIESAEIPLIEGTSAAAEHTENRERTQWPTNSIFRAPAHIRSGRESNFEPKLVSIGPYYHGQENLRRMEDLKLRCMPEIREKDGVCVRKGDHPRPWEAGRNLFQSKFAQIMMKGLIDHTPVNSFMKWEKQARAYYKDEVIPDTRRFVQMLVRDSFFIIRTIFSLSQQVQESMAFLDVHIKEIRSDLLLLENQIPLFFIRKVYEWLCPCMFDKKFPPFNSVLAQFICLDMPWRINDDGMSSEAVHLLDLYWRYSLSPQMYSKFSQLENDLKSERGRYLSEKEQPSWSEIGLSNNAPMVIANATELQKMAGIQFEKFKDKGHCDVTFSNGIMRMPRLKIDSRQTILLVNLIAFENCIQPSMRTFRCYMKLMDALIDSEEDVKLLQKCGVIYNTLSSDDIATNFFNDIGNLCFIDYNANHLSGLYKDVQIYYNSSWHRIRERYYRNPWSGYSAFAGVILLILSVLQTFYTIYGYYYPKK